MPMRSACDSLDFFNDTPPFRPSDPYTFMPANTYTSGGRSTEYHTDDTGNTDMGAQPSREQEEGAADAAADGKDQQTQQQQQPGAEVGQVVLGDEATGSPQEATATGGGR